MDKNFYFNPFENHEVVELNEYLEAYKTKILQESEKLFVTDFLFPILGSKNIKYLIPQFPFLDSEGCTRRIDFVIWKEEKKIALEVNGETYHAEGIIPNENFDDNLFRQNEILNAGYQLLRFSYSQLQKPEWRKRVSESIRKLITQQFPELISASIIKPSYLQNKVLESLDFYRSKGWKRGIVVLPTGSGKTYLSAFDSLKTNGKILFIVHRLDILSQSREAFEKIYPKEGFGILTGELQENIKARILFASKDSLKNPDILALFQPTEFAYIIVDEVHHGQAPTYQTILQYFKPTFFMLGLTATPDRMDRKDIFELFDYNKVFEYTLVEAIENGFLTSYLYYGLKDNIDYTKIKYQGNKYNLQDLDKHLIIDKRNQQILQEFLEKGQGNKAIGFCASVKHAAKMAEFFKQNGIPAVAITSQSENRAELINQFRNNRFTVAFTVDLFNEGVDFPNVRVLLFLRPTESKTIFFQQLGRGLRLSTGKERVIILDFIGNYKKANLIRHYLAKTITPQTNAKTGRIEKTIYEYSPNCEVIFEAEVEEILNNQDVNDREITKEDLVGAYYDLAERIEHKPNQQEINEYGEFKVSRYLSIFGSWTNFLREIGEFTEASYHFPQGVHLGHILYIIKILASQNLANTHLDNRYVKLRGSFADGRLGTFQRQTKFKLQSLMELGLLLDDRTLTLNENFSLELTSKGKNLVKLLKPLLSQINLSFKEKESNLPSWEMQITPQLFNQWLKDFIADQPEVQQFVENIFFSMPAVSLMLNYLYRVERKKIVSKQAIYQGFFKAPFIQNYCDQHGIESATEESAKHRCPFLINILESVGVLTQTKNQIELHKFVISKQTIQLKSKENEVELNERIKNIASYFANHSHNLTNEEVSLLRELYGKDFLTPNYFLTIFGVVSL